MGLALCRFLRDGSAMLLWGTSAYLAALVPPNLARRLARRLRRVWIAATLIALAATTAILPTEAAVIGEGWRDALHLTIVHAVLFETSIGVAWMAEMCAALLLGATSVLPRRVRVPATAATSGLLVATLVLSGHASMHEGGLGFVHRLSAALHVLAGGAWLGALLPLILLLRTMNDTVWRSEADIALHRFSTAGHAAVALVIATGVLNTALILGRWPAALSSPYQAMLALKIVLVVLMTALAVTNRYALVPKLRIRRTQTSDAIRRNTIVVVGLGLAAIGCVSIFGLLEPA